MSTTKFTGWLMLYKQNGVLIALVIPSVHQQDKIGAAHSFEQAGFPVFDVDEIKKVCIVAAPGPISVQQLKELDMDKFRPVAVAETYEDNGKWECKECLEGIETEVRPCVYDIGRKVAVGEEWDGPDTCPISGTNCNWQLVEDKDNDKRVSDPVQR